MNNVVDKNINVFNVAKISREVTYDKSMFVLFLDYVNELFSYVVP